MKKKVLRADEEVALAKRIELGDEEAKNRLIEHNHDLVCAVVNRYLANYGILSREDLIQEGEQGLIRATEGFDYRKGFKFSTYATGWIRQFITRAIGEFLSTIRVPEGKGRDIKRFELARAKFEFDYGRPPFNNKELALAMGTSPETIDCLIAAQKAWRILPLECLTVCNDLGQPLRRPLKDIVALDPADVVIRLEIRKELLALVRQADLSPVQKRIIKHRFLSEVPLTLLDVGKIEKVTAETIRLWQNKALKKIRECAEPNPKIRALFGLDD